MKISYIIEHITVKQLVEHQADYFYLILKLMIIHIRFQAMVMTMSNYMVVKMVFLLEYLTF